MDDPNEQVIEDFYASEPPKGPSVRELRRQAAERGDVAFFLDAIRTRPWSTFSLPEMLRHLMINANVVLSRQQLLDAVWGTDFYGDDSVVATYISYLRRKVDASGEPLIHTHRGFGYVLRGQRH